MAEQAKMNGSISDLKAGTNKYSVFLSKEENELIFNLIGDQCQTLCTAFVHLSINTEKIGVKTYTGYLCLIKDKQPNESTTPNYLRLFTLDNRELMWQQEITPSRKIMKSSPTLLTFKEKCEVITVEMNFSSECETQEFYDAIKTVIAVTELEERKLRRSISRQSSVRVLLKNMLGIQRHSHTSTMATVGSRLQPTPEFSLKNHEQTDSNNQGTKRTIGLPFDFKHVACGLDALNRPEISHCDDPLFQQPMDEPTVKKAENYERKQKIAKNDIEAPSNFKHLEHVGFDSAI